MTSLIVCGVHRSGTTYIGEILKRAGVCVVHEPLNERYGMKDVSIAYPYAERSEDSYVSLIDDAVCMTRTWNKDAAYLQSEGLRKLAYRIFGGRSGLRWSALRIRKQLRLGKESLCLKDPFMSLATPWLVENYRLKVICMVRHPAAIHYSTDKQQWRFDVNNLRRQPALIDRYGQDITDEQWALAEKHAAASTAILWKLMWRVNSSVAASNSRLKVVTHESLCLQPLDVAQAICEHFDIAFTATLQDFVREHSVGTRAEAEGGRIHDFRRDSSAIPDAWRGKVSSFDEDLILEIAGQEILTVYGRA
jgi:hypothetical protein